MKSNVHYVFTKTQRINSFHTSIAVLSEPVWILSSHLYQAFQIGFIFRGFPTEMCTHSLSTRTTCHALVFQ